MKVNCAWCGTEIEKEVGHVNRANKQGLKLFCGRVCFGLNKRTTPEAKKALKVEYDKKRRAELKDILKAKAKAYNESPAGRAMQKRQREKRKDWQKAYIKSEKYRKWKHDYDQLHVAKKKYGEHWESYLILKDIDKIIEPEKHQIRIQNGTLNKCQKRKRAWNSLQRTLNSHFGTPYKV